MLHPSISRVHAILQYGTGPASKRDDGEGEEEKAIPGWFIYDMKSTHGTFVNKVSNLIRLAARNMAHEFLPTVDIKVAIVNLHITGVREHKSIHRSRSFDM